MDPSSSYLVCSYSNWSTCMYDFLTGEMVTRAVGHGEAITAMGVNNKTEEIKFGVFLLCLFGISIGLFAIYGRTFVQEYKHHRIPLYVLVIVLIIYGIIALFFIICIGGSGLLTIYYQLAWDKTAPTCAIAPADSSDTDRKVEPQLHEDV